jgi:hypothetical protein
MTVQTKTIELDGDTWRVLGLGVRREGLVYAHLASTTRFRSQKNGSVPVQIIDLIDEKLIAASVAKHSP